MKDIRPLSVNLALTRKCNYNCRFCFGRLCELDREPEDARVLGIPGILAGIGCRKLTFEGGEPLLNPRLGDLLKVSRQCGLVTSVVTNGSLVTKLWLETYAPYLDWLGVSLDSSNERVEKELGRGNGGHVARVSKVASWCHELGISLKINTVVTSLNCDEDLKDTILELRPDRWKVFQVLLLNGENKERARDLAIGNRRFLGFQRRNRAVRDSGINFVAESSEMMLGSYVMALPDGRFFSNREGRHVFGRSSMIDVGVMAALREVGWDVGKFLARGGVYDYSRRNEIKGGESISKKGSSMSREAASRIQSHADKSGTNQGFKARAQSAAESNEK